MTLYSESGNDRQWKYAFFVIILSIVLSFLLIIGIIKSRENKQDSCKQFGSHYSFRYGRPGPDICVDNSTGQVRYP